MSKYLKLFQIHNEYETYSGGEMILPNVSQCIVEEEVHYNPLETKLGDYLYSDYTIGQEIKNNIIGICVSDGKEFVDKKPRYCKLNISGWKGQYSGKRSGNTLRVISDPFTDEDGLYNTNYIKNLDLYKSHPSITCAPIYYCSQDFNGSGYLPSGKELYCYIKNSETLKPLIESAGGVYHGNDGTWIWCSTNSRDDDFAMNWFWNGSDWQVGRGRSNKTHYLTFFKSN